MYPNTLAGALDFIIAFKTEYCVSPTNKEIAEALEVSETRVRRGIIPKLVKEEKIKQFHSLKAGRTIQVKGERYYAPHDGEIGVDWGKGDDFSGVFVWTAGDDINSPKYHSFLSEKEEETDEQ